MADIEFHTLFKYFVWRAKQTHSPHLTLTALAEAIGVARPVVSKWGRNKQSPAYRKNTNRPIILKLADVLKLQAPEIDMLFFSLKWPLITDRSRQEIDAMIEKIEDFLFDKIDRVFDFMDGKEGGDILPTFEPLLARTELFLGRDEAVRQISERLMQPTTQLLTLVGPGGRGKTQLALHVAEHLRPKVGKPAIVNLAPVIDDRRVLDAIAEALGIHGMQGVPLLVQVQDYLRSQRSLLLVLDNMEHVLGASPLIPALLGNPAVKIMATSRERLNLERETLWPVPPLAVPDISTALDDEVRASPAVQLFLRWAAWVGGDVSGTIEDLQAITAICERLDGNPLAIRLAAARTPHMNVHEIQHELHVRLLDASPVDAPLRQKSMQATLDWSYDLLSPPERQLFTQLAIFKGGATVTAIEAICTPADTGDVFNRLALLIDKYLLHCWSGVVGESRYAMHEILREYAAEHLSSSELVRAVEQRHATYFLQYAEQAAAGLKTAQQKQTLVLLDHDRDNFRTAVHWLLRAGEAEQAARLGSALGHYWYLRSLFQEGCDTLAATLTHTLTPRTRMKVLYYYGWLLSCQGDVQEALACYEQAEQLCRDHHEALWLGYILFGRGRIERDRNVEVARVVLEESVKIAQREHDMWLGSSALNILGILEPDVDRSCALLDQSYRAAKRIGDLDRLINAGTNLANFFRIQRDYHRAKDYFTEACQLAAELGHDYNLALSLGNLAQVMHDLHEPADQVLATMEHSLRLSRQLGDQVGIAANLVNMAEQELKLDHVEAAWHYVCEGVDVADAVEIPPLVGLALDGFAVVAWKLGRQEDAAYFFNAAEQSYGQHARDTQFYIDQWQRLQDSLGAAHVRQLVLQSQRLPLTELIRRGKTLFPVD